jgi:hypothetical protein
MEEYILESYYGRKIRNKYTGEEAFIFKINNPFQWYNPIFLQSVTEDNLPGDLYWRIAFHTFKYEWVFV